MMTSSRRRHKEVRRTRTNRSTMQICSDSRVLEDICNSKTSGAAQGRGAQQILTCQLTHKLVEEGAAAANHKQMTIIIILVYLQEDSVVVHEDVSDAAIMGRSHLLTVTLLVTMICRLTQDHVHAPDHDQACNNLSAAQQTQQQQQAGKGSLAVILPQLHLTD